MLVDPKSDPKSWEHYFKDILRRHYGPSNLKDVPDSYGGDFGVECYTFGGHVFQCYLPEQTSDKEKLTKAQKNKIRKDIYKLTNKNLNSFKKLFAGIKINRWVLATSEYVDSDVALYCSAKSVKVRKLDIPFISEDFHILVQTENDYKSEVRSLKKDVYQLNLVFDKVEGDEAEAWIDDNLAFLYKLDSKLPKVISKERILSMKSHLVQKYLEFQNLMAHLSVEWPEINSLIRDSIANRRSYLELRFLTDSGKQAGAVIASEMKKLEDDIQRKVPSLKKDDMELIQHGVIADWLIRCPLDF